MYAWFFNTVLPGPLWFRIILALLLAAGIVFLLMEFAFPWLSQFSPFNDSTLEGT
ncbi:hypothetical protein [Nesterenkonia cremea]|mgnify:CR=1 FL=1|uniref:DUF4175 domain-containing protein n=1 Tax=Nesterenkonia cremea TaxID=1882340 RepID=A0A917ELA4_9MICC|nr:hypothetical protein [Nesterenkonia cremea]GGE57999.1 hypothetical protein GCM10011401_00930 [Nesterenkonia cremea]